MLRDREGQWALGDGRLAELVASLPPDSVEVRREDDGRPYLIIRLRETPECGCAANGARSDQSVGRLKTVSLAFGIEHDLDGAIFYRWGRRLDLTPLEYEVLGCFIRRPNHLLTYEELLWSAWPDGASWREASTSDPSLVHGCVSGLREKLGDDDRRLIQVVYGRGYRFVPEPQ